MWSFEVVFNDEIFQAGIEQSDVRSEVAVFQPLVFQRLVKPFHGGVVLRGPGPGMVLSDGQFLAKLFKMLLKLRAVVLMGVFNTVIQEAVNPGQEIAG